MPGRLAGIDFSIMADKKRAGRNRTITLNSDEEKFFSEKLVKLSSKSSLSEIECKTINQDLFEVVDHLPNSFIDLLFIDPPYNLDKSFNGTKFYEMAANEYTKWVETYISKLKRCLKPTASIYFCCDWKTSYSAYSVLSKYFTIRNRITWEREKGRGAKVNWKNNIEDIWFATYGNDYIFNVDAVKLKRKVLAPYRDKNGDAKDWKDDEDGKFRLTHPSNLWTDISIPFWSMSENTDHPTQKPEKLLAKLILASSNSGALVFDPFLGSGTTSVVAKKLGRKYVGIEIDQTYASIAEKRLQDADENDSIQGYYEGVFWERNSSPTKRNQQ